MAGPALREAGRQSQVHRRRSYLERARVLGVQIGRKPEKQYTAFASGRQTNDSLQVFLVKEGAYSMPFMVSTPYQSC